ncbi:hypothetical protein Tco_0346921, partial [Tanacetum coccineum]
KDDNQAVKEHVSSLRFIALPNWFHEAYMETFDDSIRDSDAKYGSQKEQDSNIDEFKSSGITNPTTTSKDHTTDQVESVLTSTVETKVPSVSTSVPTDCLNITPVSSSGLRIISRGGSSYQETPSLGNAMSFENKLKDNWFFGDTNDSVHLNEVEANLSNMETDIQVSLTPTLRIHKD